MAAPSYDPGEQLRVTRDHATLRIHHGAAEIATIKPMLGGGAKVTADGRTWRLIETDFGWEAEGDPPATLLRRSLRSDLLTIGTNDYAVGRRAVKGLVRFEDDRTRPGLCGEILAAPRADADAHATIALATAAVVLGVDLTPDPAHAGINGDNVSAAIHYGRWMN